MSYDLKENDYQVFKILECETRRQQDSTELIASENFVSPMVLQAQGSILTNKYAEGYPHHRYYGGCENVDDVENLARERLKQLFNVKYVNVQPYSGSIANCAAIRSLINHGDRLLGMSINAGGHLSHGYSLSFSGKDYEAYGYDVNPTTYRLDYEEIRDLAIKLKPIASSNF